MTTFTPHPGMEKAWQFLWNKFYHAGTGLIYDYLVGSDADAATWHLPTPEMIREQVPNPCGHGTGMEDSMLSAGTMMDSIIARYYATGDETLRDQAAAIYKGMELCATVSPKKGYLPRSVSPVDGVSHYSNSSRDQYTHWFYGAYRFYYSGLATEAEKASMRRVLVAMSEMCEEDVVEKNQYNILREDGEIGIVCQMWGDIGPHEYLRLPMLYLITWKTTGDLHWRDMYLRYRDEALEKTYPFDHTGSRTYVGLQLQYSLHMVWDLDEDPAFRGKCLELMRKYAEIYEKKAVYQARDLVKPERIPGLAFKYYPWNKIRAQFVGFIGGKAYYNPGQSEFRENTALYPIRAVGEGLAVSALCPGYEISEEAQALLCQLSDVIDYEDHYTYAPMTLFNAYWLLEENRKIHG